MNEPDIKQHLDGRFSVLATVLASPGAQGARPIAAIGTFYSCRSILDGSTVRNVTVAHQLRHYSAYRNAKRNAGRH